MLILLLYFPLSLNSYDWNIIKLLSYAMLSITVLWKDWTLDLYKTFHPEAAEYTLVSGAHAAFFRMDHMPGHKASLNKFKEIEKNKRLHP